MQSQDWLNTVLRSIGDAVIACDQDGHVVFMNGVAEELTGWSEIEAKGHPLSEVFRIINETTRLRVESPVDRVRQLGTVVGLANHTLLLRRDGTEISIDDSGAPIFSNSGATIGAQHGMLSGIVLIFRDITERRRAERNLELLAASSQAMAAEALDVQLTLRRVAELCSEQFCDFCYFDLIDRDGVLQRSTRVHRDPAKQQWLDHALTFTPDWSDNLHPVTEAMRAGAPLLVNQVTDVWLAKAALSEEHLVAIRELNLRSLLCIPLFDGKRKLGALTFCRATNLYPFDLRDLQMGRELGGRISTAIENSRLYRALAEREASLQLALRSGQVGLWEYKPATQALVWSDRVREIFGLRPEEPINLERNFELIHPEDRVHTAEVMNASLQPDGSGEYTVEFRVVRPSGEIRCVSAQGRAFFEEAEQPLNEQTTRIATRFVGTVQDVTNAKYAEAQIRASEARFRALINNASIGVMMGDMHGGISYMNPSLLTLLGYSQQELAQGLIRWDRLTPPEFADLDRIAIEQLQATGTCEPYEKAYLDASGRPVPMLIGATLLQGDSWAAEDVAVFATDLTGLRRTESALRESEKLAAVGRLAGSIAHEINNPLEAVTNLLYLMSSKLPTLELKQLAATAQEELARVSHIVTHTLRFHRQSTRPVETRISSVLDSVLALYRGRLLNADITVVTRFQEARPITCYDGEIRQVLANLVGNAVDATPPGGRIFLRESEGKDWKTGREGLVITVADTGRGMSAETRKQAIKAFFTTKGIGGTGLGLWISDEIIRKHHGRMKVRSRERVSSEHNEQQSSGTVFQLFLPFALSPEEMTPAALP